MEKIEPTETVTSATQPSRWPIGSVWRRWDLHFHTPASFDYKNKGITDKDIVEVLTSSGVSVVAITDHHVMDIHRIRSIQALGNPRLTIFPGIEFRTELGGGESVHMIGIFAETADLNHIWTTLQGRLHITPTDVTNRGGDERVYVDFREAAETIHALGGLVSVHAGRKSNSIERIPNADEFKQAVKEDLAKTCIDLLEIGRVEDAQGYQTKVFPTIGRALPLAICSDNHNAKAYSTKSPCWFRADPTFHGLRQILNEPDDRVHRGELPPIIQRVAQNKTKYISQVSVKKLPTSKLTEKWFDCVVTFNPGLVAIIGNKGSGKSALSDILGFLGETRQSPFSFLKEDKFRQPKNNKAKHFVAALQWEDGSRSQKGLDDTIDTTAVERVKYIPQNYLETICNELRGKDSKFDEELKSVIFSHVQPPDRLEATTLDQLIEYKTQEIYAAIGLLRSELRDLNSHIASLEGMLLPGYAKALGAQLEAKQQELTAHEAAKPQPVSKPELDPEKQVTIAALTKEIDALKQELSALQQQRTKLLEDQKRLTQRKASAIKLKAKIENFRKQHQLFAADAQVECADLGLHADDLVQVKIDIEAVSQIETLADSALEEVLRGLDTATSGSVAASIAAAQSKLAEINTRLDEPNQEYQRYLGALEIWETRRADIVGDAHSPGTLEYIKGQVEQLAGIPEDLDRRRTDRRAKGQEIYSSVQSLAALYKEFYKPVQDFIEKHPLAQKGFQLDFKVSIVEAGFEGGFFDLVTQGKKGSFCGVDEGRRLLKGLLEKIDWDSPDAAIGFADQIVQHLNQDQRQAPPTPVNPMDQLKREGSLGELYDFVYSFGYLKPRYRLLWSGRELDELSPGERGTVLLLFYLLVDSDDTPLVIDQPEENLDNQTVFNILVPAIKEARQRRQIIIVTHNPNLAVVCDADQVIYAQLDKKDNNTVTYTAGAIEDPLTNRHILDVLEGTRPAFDNRDAKYRMVPE